MYKVSHSNGIIDAEIDLASSKSESNRALIIQALCSAPCSLDNLANARDTETMIRLLASNNETLDVLDAGTTMRFLTGFSAVQNKKTIMTGSDRMQNRPIALLVDALKTIGAQISYNAKDGYPPHTISPFQYNGNNKITIPGDVSSQYISSLLMIAPTLPDGLELTLTGKIGSKPYIQMTLNLMGKFGVSHIWDGNTIKVEAQEYTGGDYTIEGDWSGASYWYSIVALAENAKVQLNGLRKDSNQGDSVLVEMMPILGVKSTFNDKGVLLEKCETGDNFEWDFTHCPDIAQTISVIAAAKGIPAQLTGLESLRIKETDRIEAIKNELAHFEIEVQISGDEAIKIDKQEFKLDSNITIETYEDHRMAMSFAPLGLLQSINIKEPDVVKKSYPDYWRDLRNVGFEINE